jgi:hypothetical protein
MRRTLRPPHRHCQFDQLAPLCTALRKRVDVEKGLVEPGRKTVHGSKIESAIHKSPCLLKKPVRLDVCSTAMNL